MTACTSQTETPFHSGLEGPRRSRPKTYATAPSRRVILWHQHGGQHMDPEVAPLFRTVCPARRAVQVAREVQVGSVSGT